MTHMLQTEAWGAFQSALGRSVTTDTGDGWAYQAVLETGRLNRRLYCPYGPSVDSPTAFTAALQSLRQQASRLGADFIRLEPLGSVSVDQLEAAGGKRVSYNHLQPEQTQVIHLAGRSEDDVLGDMSSTNRNLFRNYTQKGLAVRQSTDPADIDIFLDLIKKVAARTGLRPHSDEYFRLQAQTLFPLGAAQLSIVTVEGVPAAAALVYDTPTTRYYAHAASDSHFRRLAPGSVLLASLIIDALRQRQASFDLFGIAPNDDPSHPWAGFTRFKQSFGGQRVDYVGTWDFPVNTFRYLLYAGYQTLHARLTGRR